MCVNFVGIFCLLCVGQYSSSAHSHSSSSSDFLSHNNAICAANDINCMKSSQPKKPSDFYDFTDHFKMCPNDKSVLATRTNTSNLNNLLEIYPILIETLQKVNNHCFFPLNNSISSAIHYDNEETDNDETNDSTMKVWVYSFMAVTLINLCGLFGLVVIPITNKRYYEHLLQFFVALAVGTLCGDALLHLLPHAVESHSETNNDNDNHHHHVHNEDTIWKGFVIMISIVAFFFIEKFAMFCSEWRNRKQRTANQISRVKVMHEGENVNVVGEKLCKHKYSSFPYCYDDIAVKRLESNSSDKYRNDNEICTLGPISDKSKQDKTVTSRTLLKEDFSSDNLGRNISTSDLKKKPVDFIPEDYDSTCLKQEDSNGNSNQDQHSNQHPNRETYTVIIREHENKHHGHSHTHVHVHSAPQNLSSVAWMVIMGDGLHNFTDGVAIGAAFTASIAGGFSTTVAVFCHELPHELGDFAVLLKAGMSAKEALCYSLLSSILCYVGMFCGIYLENFDKGSSWTFAVTAGSFLYIALVDLIPELSSSHLAEVGSLIKCVLQLAGILSGLFIMTFIALYEHELTHIFH